MHTVILPRLTFCIQEDPSVEVEIYETGAEMRDAARSWLAGEAAVPDTARGGYAHKAGQRHPLGRLYFCVEHLTIELMVHELMHVVQTDAQIRELDLVNKSEHREFQARWIQDALGQLLHRLFDAGFIWSAQTDNNGPFSVGKPMQLAPTAALP